MIQAFLITSRKKRDTRRSGAFQSAQGTFFRNRLPLPNLLLVEPGLFLIDLFLPKILKMTDTSTGNITLTSQADLQPIIISSLFLQRAAHTHNTLAVQTVPLKAPAAKKDTEHATFPATDQGYDGWSFSGNHGHGHTTRVNDRKKAIRVWEAESFHLFLPM